MNVQPQTLIYDPLRPRVERHLVKVFLLQMWPHVETSCPDVPGSGDLRGEAVTSLGDALGGGTEPNVPAVVLEI